jgi:hypothetical protein
LNAVGRLEKPPLEVVTLFCGQLSANVRIDQFCLNCQEPLVQRIIRKIPIFDLVALSRRQFTEKIAN